MWRMIHHCSYLTRLHMCTSLDFWHIQKIRSIISHTPPRILHISPVNTNYGSVRELKFYDNICILCLGRNCMLFYQFYLYLRFHSGNNGNFSADTFSWHIRKSSSLWHFNFCFFWFGMVCSSLPLWLLFEICITIRIRSKMYLSLCNCVWHDILKILCLICD